MRTSSRRLRRPETQRNQWIYKVQNIKYSSFVFLPKEWINSQGIKAGDKVEFTLNESGNLCVRKVQARGEVSA